MLPNCPVAKDWRGRAALIWPVQGAIIPNVSGSIFARSSGGTPISKALANGAPFWSAALSLQSAALPRSASDMPSGWPSAIAPAVRVRVVGVLGGYGG